MTRKVFNNCLNKERKIYNISYAALIGAAGCAFLPGITWGLMHAFCGGAIGFIVGGWLSQQWHAGNLQRKLYWHLPYGKYWIDKEVPESHHRELM